MPSRRPGAAPASTSAPSRSETKIRTRYLRALEAEEWEVLPGHAYVKGFLRTYANLLGLDGDALVDEYRRTVEGPQASPVPLGEGVGVLQARRQRDPSEFRGPPSRLWIVGAVILLIAGICWSSAWPAGDDEGDARPARAIARSAGRRETSRAGARATAGAPAARRMPRPRRRR